MLGGLTRDDSGDPDLAPAWHTWILVALIVLVAAVGSLLTAAGGSAAPVITGSSRVVVAYVPMLLVQWGLLAYVARIGRPRSALASLLGRRWTTVAAAASGLALAVAAFGAIEACQALPIGLAAQPGPAVRALLPFTATERWVWIAVALSAGFCEEVVYRGYLQVQLAAFTRSAAWGVALQALLFGLAHLEQGPAVAARLGLYGLGLGVLAWWRRSLLPGIVAHVAVDLLSALAQG
jgi:membrane protease YdiL (CAAX protease family)